MSMELLRSLLLLSRGGENNHDDEDPPPDASTLRIVSLLPAATDICVCLHLQDFLVGITHECDSVDSSVRVVTKDTLVVGSDSNQQLSQAQIHATIQQQPHILFDLKPTVILTQNLCNVCGPSLGTVERALVSETTTTTNNNDRPTIVNLSPTSLDDVWRDIQTVAQICGVPKRGIKVVTQIQKLLTILQQSHHANLAQTSPVIRTHFFEWLDPPFDAGHWIPDMIQRAGFEYVPLNATAAASSDDNNNHNNKSMYVPWENIVGRHQQQTENKVSVVLVACCGFDVERNVRDIQSCVELQTLIQRDVQKQPLAVYALDGNRFFNRPGPLLVFGCMILAMTYLEVQSKFNNDNIDTDTHGETMKRQLWKTLGLDESLFYKLSEAWQAVDMTTMSSEESRQSIPDVEECHESWDQIHVHACQLGNDSYRDPVTGYHVFTEVAHIRRGYCCGSGCRHCPYAHANVKDKTSKIQQPAFLHEGEAPFHPSECHDRIKVLFFSGGKDSFLALRALIRETFSTQRDTPLFSIVLLTTFDATSRTVAHQDIPIATVVRQAEHLGVPLLGVPLHRQSSISYKDRIREALDVIERKTNKKVSSLVFGDLHLQDIRKWREDQLCPLGYPTEFPLWKKDYTELMEDLEDSGVICVLSAVTTRVAGEVGDVFDRAMMKRVMQASIDGFGENGEFHTRAEVWHSPRMKVIGMQK